MTGLFPVFDDAFRAAKLMPEDAAIAALLRGHGLNVSARQAIVAEARWLLRDMRKKVAGGDLVQTFFQEIDLGSPEGLALMALAEALLRVPDAATAESLIQEKLAQGDWRRFRVTADSPRLKGLALLMGLGARLTDPDAGLARAAAALTLPAIRSMAGQVIQLIAGRFVFAPTIHEALASARRANAERYSFDMLGEGARTMTQARAFRDAYAGAIEALGREGAGFDQPTISVKLSALYPRFVPQQAERVAHELCPVLADLTALAREQGIGLTVDAEEADRLEITLGALAHAARRIPKWDGLGLAIQAYGKRTPQVIDWLDGLAAETGRRIPLRLVKGAYWDVEIKHAQAEGLADYPVFTHKAATDVSYLVCARRMLSQPRILPQFATHNVHTVTAIRHMAEGQPFEFQRLHGMGEHLYAALREKGMTAPVRVYAPVGAFKELLPYLVRRMLENSANTSFVRLALDPQQDVSDIVQDPITLLEARDSDAFARPREIYGDRANAEGRDLADPNVLAALSDFAKVRPSITVRSSTAPEVNQAVEAAARGFEKWSRTPVSVRAACLEDVADLMEARLDELAGSIVAEARRTIRDAVPEVREAIDFCRYYAQDARRLFTDRLLPGITGERNTLGLRGRGIFACVSPWNFPLSIFTGQIAAALVTGNSVIAKPAEQTPRIGAIATEIFHAAGIPRDVLHLLQGGAEIGGVLTSDARMAGVAFTGSEAAARAINRVLAKNDGPIRTLIAETGGVNAMFVDASALPEQVIDDVIASGFLSAGQRCSSLRHLFVQADCADTIIDMLGGAMDLLRVGDPADPATDIGPLIDEEAARVVSRHIAEMRKAGHRIVRQVDISHAGAGCFVPPTLIELKTPQALSREVFGPVVHVTRWSNDDLPAMLDHVRGLGYGLTLGIHSRREGFAETVRTGLRCGNVYINRNMIGAVVEAQPFGGCGLSGTGPKAGGPHYLRGFVTEETLTVNLSAIGGDVDLLTDD